MSGKKAIPGGCANGFNSGCGENVELRLGFNEPNEGLAWSFGIDVLGQKVIDSPGYGFYLHSGQSIGRGIEAKDVHTWIVFESQ